MTASSFSPMHFLNSMKQVKKTINVDLSQKLRINDNINGTPLQFPKGLSSS